MGSIHQLNDEKAAPWLAAGGTTTPVTSTTPFLDLPLSSRIPSLGYAIREYVNRLSTTWEWKITFWTGNCGRLLQNPDEVPYDPVPIRVLLCVALWVELDSIEGTRRVLHGRDLACIAAGQQSEHLRE